MRDVSEQSWEEFNRAYLLEALEELRAALRKHHAVAHSEAGEAAGGVAQLDEDADRAEAPRGGNGDSTDQSPAALESLCTSFGLSRFERRILLLCAAAELDSKFAPIYEAANNGSGPALP